MKTLIYTSSLGIAALLAEMFGLRKLIPWLVTIGLAVILFLMRGEWNHPTTDQWDMVRTDNFGLGFSALFIVITAFITTLSAFFYRNEEAKISDYLSIIVFILCGAIAMVTFGNLVMFFIGLEVLSIPLYIMAGTRRKDPRSNEAAMKYFLMGGFSSGVLLFGIALVYAVTASFNIAEIGSYAQGAEVNTIFKLGVLLILFASLFKISAVPFHFWAPDVYEGSPALATALMSTLAKIAAVAAFYRLFSTAFMPQMFDFNWLLAGITALTITVGNLSALQQTNMKRLLAFSGVSNAGYMMMGLISMGTNSANALFFYGVSYALASLAAFAIIILVMEREGNDAIDSFRGLGQRNPLLAVALSACMLSLAGIPPFAGFFGKYYIFSEAIKNGYLLLTIVAIINSIAGVYLYFKVMFAMYGTSEKKADPIATTPAYVAVIALSLIGALALGLMPQWILGMM